MKPIYYNRLNPLNVCGISTYSFIATATFFSVFTTQIISETVKPSSGNVNITQENFNNNDCRSLDFSHPFEQGTTVYWIGVRPFRFVQKIYNDPGRGDPGVFYTANEFEAGEHGGTHLDAPYHFYKDGWKVADIPIERLFLVNGIMIDCEKEASLNPDYVLEVDKLEEIKWKINERPTVIIVNYGWAKRYPNKTEYYGSPTLNITELHFPGVSEEAAKWIAENKMVVGVGLDTPSVDSGKNSQHPIAHITINGANKYILENMALDGVHFFNSQQFIMSISPMKIKDGTGAPCRIFAIHEQCYPLL